LFTEAADEINRLYEVLTMSVPRHATTADPKWAQRYGENTPGLEAVIVKVVSITQNGQEAVEMWQIHTLILC
jgi:hypothetical protein